MMRVLSESGYGESEAFYRVAQAISETLPIESREKKLLDGFSLERKSQGRNETGPVVLGSWCDEQGKILQWIHLMCEAYLTIRLNC